MVKISSSTKKAYTLVELSIVLVIIAIFLSSGLNIFTNNIVQTKTVNTKEKLNIIYKSLAEHLMTKRSLPCPTLLSKPKDSETSYGNPNQAPCSKTGGVPTRVLDLPSDMAEDDFGNKILYVVDNRLITNFVATSLTNGNGDIDIGQGSDANAPAKPVLLLLSFGANSCGSHKTNGTQNTPNICDSTNDGSGQFENSDNDTTFATSDTNPKFDDLVLTKTYYDFLQELNLTHTQSQAYFR